MKVTAALTLGAMLSLSACKESKVVGEQTSTWRAGVGSSPGVSFEVVVSGDDEGQPLIVLLHRNERTKSIPDSHLYKTSTADLRGVHEFFLEGRLVPYKGAPIFIVAFENDGVRQFREAVVPQAWLPRLNRHGFFTDGHPNWTEADFEKFWTAHGLPLFGSVPPK